MPGGNAGVGFGTLSGSADARAAAGGGLVVWTGVWGPEGDPAAAAERCDAAVGPDETHGVEHATGATMSRCGTVADTAHADRARLAGGGRCEGQGAYDVGYQLGEGKEATRISVAKFHPWRMTLQRCITADLHRGMSLLVRTGSFTSNTIPSG